MSVITVIKRQSLNANIVMPKCARSMEFGLSGKAMGIYTIFVLLATKNSDNNFPCLNHHFRDLQIKEERINGQSN